MNSLSQLRQQWEHNSELLLRVVLHDSIFVISRYDDCGSVRLRLYHYFPLGGKWSVSLDEEYSFHLQNGRLQCSSGDDISLLQAYSVLMNSVNRHFDKCMEKL